jgi:succinate dehydrogenase hydrophobic anchor subunit
MQRSVQRNSAGLSWWLQSVSGFLLVVLLLVHMIANHFVVPGGLQTYRDVVNYLSNPMIVILELAFLIVVTAHALLGVRAILFDTGLSRQSERRASALLTILGVLIVAYGVWLTALIANR